MDMTLRKENGVRSIVAEEFDLMLFPENVQGHLLGTYCDGEIFGFTVSPELRECLPKNVELEEKITNLIETFRRTENDMKEESWSKVIEG